MFLRFIFLKCDDCERSATKFSKKQAQAEGWHFDRDGEHCYCTKCAPFHRNIDAQSAQRGGAVLAFGCGE